MGPALSVAFGGFGGATALLSLLGCSLLERAAASLGSGVEVSLFFFRRPADVFVFVAHAAILPRPGRAPTGLRNVAFSSGFRSLEAERADLRFVV
jgi:hypothetical protein